MFTAEQAEKLLIKIEDLELGGRVQRVMKERGISHVALLLSYSEAEMRRMEGLGRKSYDEITEAVKKLGFEMSMPVLCEYENSLRQYAPYTEEQLYDRLEAMSLVPPRQSATGQPAPPKDDEFEAWAMSKLPQNLREGLTPEFLRGALADERLQRKIADINADADRKIQRALVHAISGKLGIS